MQEGDPKKGVTESASGKRHGGGEEKGKKSIDFVVFGRGRKAKEKEKRGVKTSGNPRL